jgi:hydrogenase maturation protease
MWSPEIEAMKSLIVGLGNPIMGDDAIGCRCAEAIEAALSPQELESVEVIQFFRGGISLMERLIDYDRVLIIDSITGCGLEPGAVRKLTLDEIPSYTVNSPHDGSLKTALEFGRQMGVELPHQVDILAVEIEPKYEFSDQLSASIEAGIPQVFQLAMDWIIREETVTE